MDGLSPYLTMRQAADELGCSLVDVNDAINRGDLHAIQRPSIPRPAFEAYRRKLAMRAAADRESLKTEIKWAIKIGHLAA